MYATHPTNTALAYMVLSGGYGHTVAAVAGSGNAISQGEKLYMTPVSGNTRPTYTNVSANNFFVGYALAATDAAAGANNIVAAGATGDVLCWFRPQAVA